MFIIAKFTDLITTYIGITTWSLVLYEGNPVTAYILHNYGWLALWAFCLSGGLFTGAYLSNYQDKLVKKNVPDKVLLIFRIGVLLCICVSLLPTANNALQIYIAIAGGF